MLSGRQTKFEVILDLVGLFILFGVIRSESILVMKFWDPPERDDSCKTASQFENSRKLQVHSPISHGRTNGLIGNS